MNYRYDTPGESDRLGRTIWERVRENPDDFMEVERRVLERLGIPLYSPAFGDWLSRHTLRMLRPGRRWVRFVRRPAPGVLK